MQRHRMKIHLGLHRNRDTQTTKATNEGIGTVNQTKGHEDSGSKKKHGFRHWVQIERQGHRGGESD